MLEIESLTPEITTIRLMPYGSHKIGTQARKKLLENALIFDFLDFYRLLV